MRLTIKKTITIILALLISCNAYSGAIRPFIIFAKEIIDTWVTPFQIGAPDGSVYNKSIATNSLGDVFIGGYTDIGPVQNLAYF